MTILTTNRQAGPFPEGQYAMSFAFKVFSPTDVAVLETVGDTTTALVYGTQYTVGLNADQDMNPGGDVAIDAGYPWPGVGATYKVTSRMAALQQVAYTGVGTIHPRTIVEQFDRIVILIQQLLTSGVGGGGGGGGGDGTLRDELASGAGGGMVGAWGPGGATTVQAEIDRLETLIGGGGGGGGDTDPNLRADLASATSLKGSALIGHLDGATSTTVRAMLNSLKTSAAAGTILTETRAGMENKKVFGTLVPNRWYWITDDQKMAYAKGASDYIDVGPSAGGGGGGGGATGFNKTKIVVMGDSMAAVQAGLSDSWPERWAALLRNCGVPVDLVNIAIGGYTFNKANTVTIGYSGETMVQRAIALAPDIVVVCLGANDAILNVESRTLAQTQADANSCLSALRAGLPSATIIVCNEYMYDADGFTSPATTLKNKGVFPYIMAKPASGLLNGCWGAEMLDNDVGSATRTAFSNWATLMGTVNAHAAVNGTMQLNAWKAFRLGLGGLDGVHLTSAGNQFLAAYALKASQDLPALMTRWPKLNLDTFDTWTDPDAIFAGVLTRSGENWNINADTYPSDFVSKHGQIQSYRPETWWAPSGAVVNVSSLSHPANTTFPTYWSVTNARPRSVCQVSVDGGAWGGTATTDAYGDAQFMANGAALAVGTHTLRYKVGNEVFGPFSQVTQAKSEVFEDTSVVPSIQLRRSSDWAPTAGAFTAVPYDVTIHNRGGGSYASGTYTVPKSGSYFVSHIVGAIAPGAGLIIAAVYVNGNSAVEGGSQTNGDINFNRYIGSTAAGVVYLNAGDAVTWTFYASSTASVVGPGSRNRSCTASLCYLGA